MGRITDLRAKLLRAAGLLAQSQGDIASARKSSEESLAIRYQLGDKKGIALALGNLGIVLYRQGDLTDAQKLSEESLNMLRELGDSRGAAADLNNLANIAYDLGDYEKALRLFQESRDVWAKLGDQRGLSWAYHGMGNTSLAQEKYRDALQYFKVSLQGWRELGHKQGIVLELENFAEVAIFLGQIEKATVLLGVSDILRKTIGLPVDQIKQEPYNNNVTCIKQALGENKFINLWAEGQRIDLEEAINIAFTIE